MKKGEGEGDTVRDTETLLTAAILDVAAYKGVLQKDRGSGFPLCAVYGRHYSS